MTRALGTRAVAPAFVALLTSFLVAAPTAQAQFGGLIKRAVAGKAADKVTDKVADKIGPKAPLAGGEAFSATTLEQVIAGARAMNTVMQRQADLQQRRTAVQAQLGAPRQNDGIRNAYAQANQKILSCRDASFNDSERKRDEQLNAYMTTRNSENIARVQRAAAKYGKAITDAQQRRDTAAEARAERDFQYAIIGTDVLTAARGDTAAADAKCGKLPAKPAALVAEEQQRAQVAALDDSIRASEAYAVTAGAQASGMDKVRYLELRERLASIMSAVAGNRLSVSYGDEEMDLVRQHEAELDPLRHAIGASRRVTRAR